ncbi:MAG: alternative ribosome rescue aminoacyl-tRNA hydrolase ArfB [Acidimicrobiales bacterium]
MTSSCSIPVNELEWRFDTSGGPGGQHANTSHTRVEVSFDVATSPSLGPRQRARLIEKLGPVVRVTARDERSQLRNRQLALKRLAERLGAALKPDVPRRSTRPTAGSQARRVQAKRQRAETKRLRQNTDLDD